MRRSQLLPLLTLVALLPAGAQAQITVDVSVSLPTIRFEVQPALVVVAPGIRVVPSHAHEIFFVGGYYWTVHDGHWHRAHDWRHPKWKKWKKNKVPPGLVGLPHGKYRHYKAAKKAAKAQEKRHKAAEKRHKAVHKGPKKGRGKKHKKGKKH